MTNQTHRIVQQQINLAWVNVAEPSRAKHQLAEFAKQQLLPQMEVLFDELTRDGRLLQFDKVVIDLGDISAANWRHDFCEKVVGHLKKHLTQHTTDSDVPGTTGGDHAQSAEIIFKQLLFFLKHGRLPWWGATRERSELGKAVSRFTPSQWRLLSQVIDQDLQARNRLIIFGEDEQLERYLRAVHGLDHAAQVLSLFISIPSDDSLFQTWRFYCWSRLFEVATAQQQPKAVMQHLQELLALRAVAGGWKKESSPQGRTFTLDLQSRQALSRLPEPWRAWIDPLLKIDHQWEIREHNIGSLLRRLVAAESFDTLIHSTTQAQQDLGPSPEPSPPMTAAGPAFAEKTGKVAKSPKDQDREVASPITVAAAGMVIVHPFIQELFREQSLLKDDVFFSEECRHTAVHMLRYLAFGDLDRDEYDLLLPKLLCAMPWEQVLLPWELTGAQQKGCDQLLLATLHHWQALKSRSIQFLRQQFFWRDGKLKATDNGWRLTMEKRAQDILLDKLPWGVGVVRMPWMKQILYVNWDT